MRTKIILAVLVVIVALVAWVMLRPTTVSGRVGMNRLVENTVTTMAAGSSESQPSVIGADVNFGDRVATGAASRLEISLLDRSMLTVGALTRLEIDRFVYDPERDIVGVAVSILRGTFRFVSNNQGSQPEAIAFRTRGGAIGIRGTMIEGVVGPEAVAFLAGIPGAPDLSAEADSAAVIILREGVIDVTVSGQSVVLDRPVQMVAFTETRIYPPFGVSDETTRRFEVLLPSRPGPAAPPTAPSAPPPVPPIVEPVVEAQPPVVTRDPVRPTVSAPVAPRPVPVREPAPAADPVLVAPAADAQREPARPTASSIAAAPAADAQREPPRPTVSSVPVAPAADAQREPSRPIVSSTPVTRPPVADRESPPPPTSAPRGR
jgi:hypothetical protein